MAHAPNKAHTPGKAVVPHGHDDHHAPTAEGDDLPHHGPAVIEPRSPAWLPFLGAALLGVGLVVWLALPEDPPRKPEPEQQAEPAASAAVSAEPQPAAPTPPPRPAGRPLKPGQPVPHVPGDGHGH
jgi:hypothetical protein